MVIEEILVVKFGGTSLLSYESIKARANKIKQILLEKSQSKVIVVVSAMGGVTNRLLMNISEFGLPNFQTTSADLILSSGETNSAAMFSAALQNIGVASLPLCGWQVPIEVSSKRIDSVGTDKIMNLLTKNIVPVIAGFQGINSDGSVSVLNRGGSDVTAAAIAAAMHSKKCIIYTDVYGIYRLSPGIIDMTYTPHCKIDIIDYEDAYKLAYNGAKVIHHEAIEIAQKTGLELWICPFFRSQLNGTVICESKIKQFGLTVSQRGSILKLYALHNNQLPWLLNRLASSGAQVEHINENEAIVQIQTRDILNMRETFEAISLNRTPV